MTLPEELYRELCSKPELLSPVFDQTVEDLLQLGMVLREKQRAEAGVLEDAAEEVSKP